MNSRDDAYRNGQPVGSHEPASSVREITLFGDYDLSRKDEVAKLFGSLDGVQPLIINFSRVTFLDSTVLALLAQLRLRSVGRQIILSDASDQIRRLFRLVGFEKIFDITEPTQEGAGRRDGASLMQRVRTEDLDRRIASED